MRLGSGETAVIMPGTLPLPPATQEKQRGAEEGRDTGASGHRDGRHGAYRRPAYAERYPADLKYGGSRGTRVQCGLLERRGNRQVAELRGRPDDQERPARHLTLGDGAVIGEAFAVVVAGIIGKPPVIAHHPEKPGRDDDAERLDRRWRARVQSQ